MESRRRFGKDEASPGEHAAPVSPFGPGADVATVSPVPVQMRRAESRGDMYSVDSPQGMFVAIVLLIACAGGRCAPGDAW